MTLALATETSIKKLDELLVLLAQDSDPASDASLLADEHVRGARAYLLGAMYSEYELNLQLARKAVARIHDDRVRAQAERILDSLIDTKK